MTTVQDTLRLFGITRCYKGFKHTAYALSVWQFMMNLV